MSPQRIQRKRAKGWRAPVGAVYVGRGSKWGNPFKVLQRDCRCWDVEDENGVTYLLDQRMHTPGVCSGATSKRRAARVASDLFASLFGVFGERSIGQLVSLRGKDLMCWCPLDQPCHADVLPTRTSQQGDTMSTERDELAKVIQASEPALYKLYDHDIEEVADAILAAGYRKPRLEYGIFRKRDSMDYQEPFDPAVFDSVEKAEEYKRANYRESGWPWLEIRSRPAPGAWTRETL